MVKIDVHNDKEYTGNDEWCIMIIANGEVVYHDHFDDKPEIAVKDARG